MHFIELNRRRADVSHHSHINHEVVAFEYLPLAKRKVKSPLSAHGQLVGRPDIAQRISLRNLTQRDGLEAFLDGVDIRLRLLPATRLSAAALNGSDVADAELFHDRLRQQKFNLPRSNALGDHGHRNGDVFPPLLCNKGRHRLCLIGGYIKNRTAHARFPAVVALPSLQISGQNLRMLKRRQKPVGLTAGYRNDDIDAW